MKTKIKQTHIVTAASLAFLLGLVAGRYAIMPLWPVLVAAGILIGFWRSRWRPVAIISLCLILGIWRAATANVYDQTLNHVYGQKVTITGTVKDDPAVSDTNQLSFAIATSTLNGRPYHTSINIYTFRTPIHRGYTVTIVGKPKPALGASLAQISFPTMTVTSSKLSWLEQWRLRFFAAVRTAIPEPLASFALGLLVGARALIPKTLNAQLSAVGLSHLVAVSGYNLTIIVDAVRRAFKKSGKFLVLGLSLWLIAGFVIVAGASASIVRAAVVSIMTLVAGYYGRSIKPLLLLAIAAALTAGYTPHAMYADLGWQLSFAAFAGILLLAPALNRRFGGDKHLLIALACEAMAAYVVTLPIILHSFGTFTPIAPLANLAVMPLVPLAMLASFIAGVATLTVPLVAGWVSWPATLLLRFMTGIIEQASRVHPVGIHMSVTAMWLWYGLLALVTYLLTRQPKPDQTCYNSNEEEVDTDVRTLKVA